MKFTIVATTLFSIVVSSSAQQHHVHWRIDRELQDVPVPPGGGFTPPSAAPTGDVLSGKSSKSKGSKSSTSKSSKTASPTDMFATDAPTDMLTDSPTDPLTTSKSSKSSSESKSGKATTKLFRPRSAKSAKSESRVLV